jgi:hypothetical protein
MIRKQIYLRSDQDQLIKRQAAHLGISAAELIRRRLQQPDALSAVSRPARPSAWNEEMRFIKRRERELPDMKGKRTWTREELYEDRFARFSGRH